MKQQTFSKVFFGGVLGILIFLIILGILNITSGNVENQVFNDVVKFLNQNLLIILSISIIFLIANIFEVFIFPFNIFYPLFNAVGSLFWVEFIFRILKLVSSFIVPDIYKMFIPFYILAIVFIPIIVMIVGYAKIIHRLIPKKSNKKKNQDSEWKVIGDEIKSAIDALTRTINERLGQKNKKKKS